MILVTGATGFIGRHLVRRLVNYGEEVRCLVRRTSDASILPVRDIELVDVELTDTIGLTRVVADCEVVYHLAARTSAMTRSELYDTNVHGCRALAAACAATFDAEGLAPTLILVSSLAASGTAIAGRSRRVTDPERPVSEYGRSKLAGEQAACDYSDRVPISIVRPGIVIGADSHELQPVIESISRFRIHFVPGYTPRRVALIHVDDLIEILLRVARSGRRVAATQEDVRRRDGYYVAATDALTYAELGRMIGRALGVAPPLVLPIAESLAWVAAAGYQVANRCRGTSESFNVDKMREAFAGDWVGETEALSRDLHFSPPYSLQQRLTDLSRNGRDKLPAPRQPIQYADPMQ